MARIEIKDIAKLRNLVGDSLYPFADYASDTDTIIEIVLYRKDENGKMIASPDFREDRDGALSNELREKIISELWTKNFDKDLVDKLEELDITVVFPRKRSSLFSR